MTSFDDLEPDRPARILVVDDEEPLRVLLRRIVELDGHQCTEAATAAQARALIDAREPDLVLCDINMPGESGLTVVRHITDRHPDIAVVIVSGVDDATIARTALDLGVYGYLIKPFDQSQIRMVIMQALHRRALEIDNRLYREKLEDLVLQRTVQLRASQAETIKRLAMAAEHRDPETATHLERMSRYSELLAQRAGLRGHDVEMIRIASPMHDVGKIGIPDAVLTHPGRFTDEHRAVMCEHPRIGHRILSGSTSEVLEVAATIALTHHEKWDGSGYPQGLAGEEIPIAGRIVAVADVFDALTSRRRYKAAFPVGDAVDLLLTEAGSHFDPDLVERFVDDLDPLVDIMTHYAEDSGAIVLR